jgi:hypothetical protein
MKKLLLASVWMLSISAYGQTVTVYENPNYQGSSKTLSVGQYSLSDFNDMISSVKVPPGMVIILYEHSGGTQGYGVTVDLMEDQPDLSTLNFNDITSYAIVSPTTRNNTYVWARGSIKDGQYVAGHWERMRANGMLPANGGPVVSPGIAPPAPTNPSVLSVNGPTTTITSLGLQSTEGQMKWTIAMNDQMGVFGNDYRGIDEIGSSCFERASNNTFIPDNINFWYPQKQKNDHRSVVYFKRTLVGTVKRADQFVHAGTFQDYDINVDIIPDPKYMYLLTDAHPIEHTAIMSAEYYGTRVLPYLEDEGQKDCDDPASKEEFTYLEAEIAPEYWPQGDHKYGRARLADLCLIRTGGKMAVYGPWIYDAGHCCHPEIHPAEQLWWSQPQDNGKLYNLNVFCDASRRYLWRNQMDDGTKLKPWAEPPIKGIFAIAFEYLLPKAESAVAYTTRQFEVTNLEDHNVIEYPNANQTYSLVYNGKTLVTFLPHNDAFKVSFEHVGITADAPDRIKGFLVIETSVGTTKQIATSVVFPGTATPYTLPAGSAPEAAPEALEKLFFKKDDGRYMFTVKESSISTGGGTRVIDRRRISN